MIAFHQSYIKRISDIDASSTERKKNLNLEVKKKSFKFELRKSISAMGKKKLC